MWAKLIGGPAHELYYFGPTVAVDPYGNVVVAGTFEESIDCAGSATLISAGEWDVFVCKLDSSGNLMWAKSFGGLSWEHVLNVAVDQEGNIYTTGSFFDTGDFDPGPGVENLVSRGGVDVFVSKLTSNGEFVWARSFGSGGYDEGRSLAADPNGNVLITGRFDYTVDFDPGPGGFNLRSAGQDDIFISKLDEQGNFLWAKRLGGPFAEFPLLRTAVATDSDGNAFVTGRFKHTADFEFGATTGTVTSAGEYDVFVWKLDSSGECLWVKTMGGVGEDEGGSLAVDSAGYICILGRFRSWADFDPGPEIAGLSSVHSDIFICVLDNSGNFEWAAQLGADTGNYEAGKCVAVDPHGNVLITGQFSNTVDFDPGPAIANLNGSPYGSSFVWKLVVAPCVVSSVRNTASPTRAANVGFTVVFNQPVMGVDITDFALTTSGGITAASILGVSGSQTSRNVTVNTGSGDGTIRLDLVDNDSIVNADSMPLGGTGPGNGTFTMGESYVIDKTGPTSALSSSATNPTIAPITVDVFLSETSTNFILDDIAVTNATASGFTGNGSTYSFTLTPIANGPFTAQIPAGSFTDVAGNGNMASNELNYTYATTDGMISIGPPNPNVTKAGPVVYLVTYTGANAINLNDSHVTLNTTGTATGTITTSVAGPDLRMVTITNISGTGSLGISIAAGTATDAFGNIAPAAGPSATFVVDNTAPTIVIGTPSLSTTSTGPVFYPVTYTGADTITLGNSDIVLNSTGTATGTVVVSGSGLDSRTVAIWDISGDGTLGISISPETAADALGNLSDAAGPSTAVVVDSNAPALPVTPWHIGIVLLTALLVRTFLSRELVRKP
ncbi:MAG: SBBP repeat-containing protein [Candidatus Hydrogenedentes bacterium]|nr:SBBP repeat-containing protein [Candidatus Hydrogenedentota bacterium]